MKRILLVEDDISLRETLSERLVKEGYDVVVAQNIRNARQIFDRETFDVVVLDVGLPDGSGYDLARHVRQNTQVPFLFMTALAKPEDRLKGYELGAEEYLPKPFHLKEFLLRIRHVLENHARKMHFTSQDLDIDFQSMTLTPKKGAAAQLNKKENAVLQLLVERSPQVVSRDEILNRVWGESEFPTARTVDNVILSLRQILGEKNSDRIRSVRGVGYQWVGEK